MHHRPEQVENGFLLSIQYPVESFGTHQRSIHALQMRLHPLGLCAQTLYLSGHSFGGRFIRRRPLRARAFITFGLGLFLMLIGVRHDPRGPCVPGSHLLRLEIELALEIVQGLLRVFDPVEILKTMIHATTLRSRRRRVGEDAGRGHQQHACRH